MNAMEKRLYSWSLTILLLQVFAIESLFIQDGKLYHEIRRDHPRESQKGFLPKNLEGDVDIAGGEQDVF